MERPTCSIVMPVKDEGDFFGQVLDGCCRNAPERAEILCVFQDRSDSSLPVARACRDPRVKILFSAPGVLAAYREGFARAAAALVVTAMSDGSDDLAQLPRMVAEADDGQTVVVASRYVRGGGRLGGPRLKAALSRGAGLALHALEALPVHDATNNFRLYPRTFLRATRIESTYGFEVALELLVKAQREGLRIVEIPTVWHAREHGASKFRLLASLPAYGRWFVRAVAQR